jgi:hypothetical protein
MQKLFLSIASASVAMSVAAAPLDLVGVDSSNLVCVFNPECFVTVDDMVDDITYSGVSGSGFLQTRLFTGLTGAPAAGLYAYSFRINMGDLPSVTYIDSFTINFGPVVNTLDYDGDSDADEACVITQGGIGSVGPTSAVATGTNVTFSFSTPIYGGDSSYFFGLVSANAPTNYPATVNGSEGPIYTLQSMGPRF